VKMIMNPRVPYKKLNFLIDCYWGPGTSFLLRIQEDQCLILKSVVSHFNFEIFVVLSPNPDK
jgi:hypothetical protein